MYPCGIGYCTVHQNTIKLADFDRSFLKGSDCYNSEVLDILNGLREEPIKHKFIELYQKCWKCEPDKRPDIRQVNSELNT
ncbi:kinase-like domain-containing protein [Rhizophagus irregularis DAOM 181602=DAOM 197198]|nr:kinase-like domain-containing protein [Rhizophagus irregularis DAOM 181602=DAOM 197198]